MDWRTMLAYISRALLSRQVIERPLDDGTFFRVNLFGEDMNRPRERKRGRHRRRGAHQPDVRDGDTHRRLLRLDFEVEGADVAFYVDLDSGDHERRTVSAFGRLCANVTARHPQGGAQEESRQQGH